MSVPRSRPQSSACRETVLSPPFQPEHRASSFLDTPDYTIMCRGGTSAPLITLHKNARSPNQRSMQKAMRQKRELSEQLMDENMRPLKLLRRVGECSTPFAKLIRQTVEEFEHVVDKGRPIHMGNLERNSSINCAKIEVDVRHWKECAMKGASETTDLRAQLKTSQALLSQLNYEIDALHNLATLAGVDDEPGRKSREVRPKPVLHEVPPNDEPEQPQSFSMKDEEYQALWIEQQELLEITEMLRAELRQKQEGQLAEMKALIQRRRNKPSTV